MRDSYNLKSAPRRASSTFWVTVAVLLILAVIKVLGQVPGQLLLTVGVIFLACSALFWGTYLSRGAREQGSRGENIHSPLPPRTPAPLLRSPLLLRSPAPLLLVWLLITALLLGGVYYVDRGGWNWFLISGYDVTVAEDFSAAVDLSSADFVTQYPFFVLDPQPPLGPPQRGGKEGGVLVLPKGEYIIRETIVVPRGTVLTIEPGTVLRFGAGRSLISYSPIIARGTESEPIHFTAQNKWLKWGAVGLVQAGQAVFEHVRFDHGRRASVNGVDFFGALSLIETDVEISHSQFVDLFGKDGVNVRYGHVLIQDNLFRNTYKDGLDLDGGSGEVSHNQFIDCDDEGIDLSENDEVQVFENTILDRRGGRMAAENNLEALMALNTLGYSDEANQR